MANVPGNWFTQLKFADRTDLAPWMAGWMGVAGKELLATSDVIVPVPLHFNRLLQRRFNQSAELARNIAKQHEIAIVPEALVRRRKTKQQTGLTESQREKKCFRCVCCASGTAYRNRR